MKDKKRKTDINFEPLPLPSAEDKLFDKAEDWWHNACLNYVHDGWSPYIIGYKDAADILVAHVRENRRSQDTLVYPILFLYRQYLELAIKNLIHKGRKLQDIHERIPKGHMINDLWKICEKLLNDISPCDSVKEIEQINRLISEFYSVDPKSTAFRYPEDKEGKPSLPGITHIDIMNVRNVIGKISVILNGADAQLSEYLSIKADISSDRYDL
jgi:hypothetical protein